MRGFIGLAVLVSTSGCVFDASVADASRLTCASDAECPHGLRCVEGAFVCADPAGPCVVEAGGRLVAQPDGAACEDGAEPRVCIAAACELSRCGDGIVDARNEECDGGADNSDAIANACRTTCRAPRCGDDVRDDFETCDGDASNAETCALCVASCGLFAGSCDGDDADLCDCVPELLAAEPRDFQSLFAVAADATFAYTAGPAGEVRRTPLGGGASAALGPAPAREQVIVDMFPDGGALWVQVINLTDAISELYLVEKDTGAEALVSASASTAVDDAYVWVVASALFRARKADGQTDVMFAGEPYAAERVAVTDTHVVFSDEAGVVRALARDAAPGTDADVIAERQFSVLRIVGSGALAGWIDGVSVWRWTPDAGVATALPRLSDGQQGLEVRDLAIVGEDFYLAVEDRSDRRPGGLMRLQPNGHAWTQQWRGTVFRFTRSAAGIVMLSPDGLRVLPTG